MLETQLRPRQSYDPRGALVMPSQHTTARPDAPRASDLNVDALRERAGHDEELVREVLTDFLDGSAAQLARLSAAVSAHKFAETSTLAHRLRGALLALGAERAAHAAEQVEFLAAGLVTAPSVVTGELMALASAERALDACLALAHAKMRQLLAG